MVDVTKPENNSVAYKILFDMAQKLRDSSQRMQRDKCNCQSAKNNGLEKLIMESGRVVHTFSQHQDFDWYNLEARHLERLPFVRKFR